MICWEWNLCVNWNQQSLLLSLQFTMFGVWCSVWILLVGVTVGQSSIPWLLCAPRLIFPTPSCSCSYAHLLAIHSWKCRFATDLVFHTCCRRKSPALFFHVPVFISSCLCFDPSPSHFIVVGQSKPGSALKHWQVHEFKQAPPAWWNSHTHKSDNHHWNQLPNRHQILLMLTFSNSRIPASKTEHLQYSKKPNK